MRLTAITVLVLLAGCTYAPPEKTANNSSNLTLDYPKNEVLGQEGLSEPIAQDPGLYSHSVMVNSYNPVLLYSLNQDYIKNSKIRYGLFKLYVSAPLGVDNVALHAYVPGYSYWTLQEIKLSNGSYEGFHTVNFTGLVLKIENATPAVLEYYLTYEFGGMGFQTSTAKFPFTITGRRNITWWYNSDWDQPDAIMQAGWITPAQPEILKFAKTSLGLNNTSDYRSAYLIAMEVYNSLFRAAILYEANLLDKRLPIDVILDGKGDCDEMSALYASILEAIGIETKQVNIPGHQYMLIKLGEYWKAFDPTITEYYGNRIFADFTYSMERGEEEFRDIGKNATIYYPREEWDMGLGMVAVPGAG